MRLVAVVALVVVGCAADVTPEQYVDPSERAVRIYTATHGALADECAQHAYETQVVWMDQLELVRTCQSQSRSLWGCAMYDPDGSTVYIHYKGGDGGTTPTHELLHVLLACEGEDAEANRTHADEVWNWPGIR